MIGSSRLIGLTLPRTPYPPNNSRNFLLDGFASLNFIPIHQLHWLLYLLSSSWRGEIGEEWAIMGVLGGGFNGVEGGCCGFESRRVESSSV